jgi:hypothetical protein
MDLLFGLILGFCGGVTFAAYTIWKLKKKGYLKITDKLINFLRNEM